MRSPNSLTFYIDQVKFYDKPDLREMWVLKGKEALVKTFRTGREKSFFMELIVFKIKIFWFKTNLRKQVRLPLHS
jgi:hypothetical protein